MIINDDILGEIRLIANSRAKRIIVRKKYDHLQLTHPLNTPYSYIKESIERMKPQLKKMIEKEVENQKVFNSKTNFSTFSFVLKITESESTVNFYTNFKNNILYISCPIGTDFEKVNTQEKIKTIIEKTMRFEANRIFPTKTIQFANEHGFEVASININKSKTRWGSCSSKKKINLSYYCMLLPEYLADFVILHELCHTVEMNHGDRFWNLLDKVSNGRAKELTKELKKFKIRWRI